MNWLTLIIVLIFAVSVAAWGRRQLTRRKPQWSAGRQMLTTVFALPVLILLATLMGMAWVLLSGPGEGENMQDLALAVMAAIGALFALIALAGGVIGAALARRDRRS